MSFEFDRVHEHLSSQCLLQENCPRVLVLDEGADRAAAGTTQLSKFFEASEDLRQPGFQHRPFDLHDIPVQDEKRDLAEGVVSEKSHGRRVIVGAGLGCCVDDGEDGVAPTGEGKGFIVNEKLSSTEERDARPIDELGQILLGVDQRVIVLAQIFVKPGLAHAPILDAFIGGALRKERVIQSGRMEFTEAVLGVSADIVKEVVRVPSRGVRADERRAAIVE